MNAGDFYAKIKARNIRQARSKLALCLRNARDSSRDSWQHADTPALGREYKRLRRESMQDARYWRDLINDLEAHT